MKFNDVFVVDDDKIYHFLIKKLLACNNIDVNPLFFENGLLAIEGIKTKIDNRESLPDLILLDINMPILDGWQFLEEFRLLKDKIEKEIIIYIISSSDNTVDKDKAKEFKEEVKDYYLKPVTVDALKAIFSI
ncbi:response regulator [Flavobacterium silvisoli]|uniref:Response regulator n=1 Tax=Flavobacterium silvisoli TaxID=2529433 RepID=A0A4Q9Z220_9FLAO|nr:response regulator [Flavobacterium silvisoli]TBX70414.1 response regulator [Flavobacterium silvisoli]